MGLPISVNWTFFASSYGWGATSDYLFKIGDFAPTLAGWPKISGRRGQKTRLNYISHGIKIWTDFSSVLSQCTHLTDRQTDGLTDGQTVRRADINLIARPRLHSTQRCKNTINSTSKTMEDQICSLNCTFKWSKSEEVNVIDGRLVHTFITRLQ